MPNLSGVVTGILLTILAVFVIDNVNDAPGSRDIVNWDVISTELGESAKKVSEEVRQEVHEATAPDSDDAASATDDKTPAAPSETP